MSVPAPNQLCELCLNLMNDLISRDIPWELEPGIPHQPNITLLEQSSLTCALCYQIWVAAGRTLANRGGMMTFHPKRMINDVEVTVQAAASNYGLGGMFKAMDNGAMVSHSPDDIAADLSELEWVHPATLTGQPEKVGVYLFGNWYMSPFQGQERTLMLVGLGVRLGTSPEIRDALGNKPDEWFLAGSYLRFRTEHDSAISFCIPGRIRNSDLSSDKAMCQVRSWLSICDKHHRCLEPGRLVGNGPILPTRVLSVNSPSGQVHLVETGGRPGRYIALSHSWGKSHRLTLTKANLKTLTAGIGLEQLPKTFKDAIQVCKALKVEYLWIDSLCIVQDDPEDWEMEAAKMSSVYSDSYLTISALHSSDDEDGCFPSTTREKPFPFVSPDVICTGRPTVANAIPMVIPKETIGAEMDSYNYAVAFSVHGIGDRKYYITNEWMPPSIETSQRRYGIFNFGTNFDPLRTEPLSSRGWVLQERLLSPRTLHYSQGQMYWECQNIVLGEDGSMLQRKFPQVSTLVESRKKAVVVASNVQGAESQYMADEWLRLIELFSTRNLTVPHDKLVAISGLAQIVAERSNDEYCAGIWKSNLLNGLCWKAKVFTPHHMCNDEAHDHALPSAKQAELVLPNEYRAPSWSWAAVDGEIEFQSLWLTISEADVKSVVANAVNFGCTPFGEHEFGRVRTAFTIIGDLHLVSGSGSSTISKDFRVSAILRPVIGSFYDGKKYTDKPVTEKKGALSKMFSSLKVTAPFSSAPTTVSCKISFDIEQKFPCRAAFITKTLALVLSCKQNNNYTRVGVAEFDEKESQPFIKAARMSEIFIL